MSRTYTVKCDWCSKEVEVTMDREGSLRMPKKWQWMTGTVAFGLPLKSKSKRLEFCGDGCVKEYRKLASAADAASDKAWKETYRAGRLAYNAGKKQQAAAIQAGADAKKLQELKPANTPNTQGNDGAVASNTMNVGGVVNDDGVERFKKLEL